MRRSWLLLLLPLLSSTLAATNDSESLVWGTWRPGLYFGLRPRLPQSLMTGLIWFGTQDFESFMRPRHQCDQGDGLDAYTWTTHDPREGGVQVLKDGKNNVEITIEWLKVAGGENGGSWAARIKGIPMYPDLPMRTSFIPYFGLEGLGSLELDNVEEENGLEGQVSFSGASPDLGDFRIRIVEHPGNSGVTDGFHVQDFTETLGMTHFLGVRVEDGHTWQAKDAIMPKILEGAQARVGSYQITEEQGPPDPSFVLRLPNEVYSGSNLFAVQKIFDGKFQFDIFFESGSAKQKLDASLIDHGIPAFTEAYGRRFEAIFPLPASADPSKLAFSKAITSNLLGGIGYFYGNSLVDRAFAYEWDDDEEFGEDGESTKTQQGNARYSEPKELLTATPSRSFFPRGFYWDEGFHLLHIGAWDTGLSLEILRDWINLIDEDGWVAREQILGEEARSRVPAEFITQHPTYANPPTLTMAITAIIARMRSSAQDPLSDLGLQDAQVPMFASEPSDASSYQPAASEALSYLKSIYPPLKRHYDWFRRTQRGQIKQYSRNARSRTEAYRWRGRSPDHVLTSGMDDYPRGPPHAGELHLDLISWMGFFTRTMKDIANFVDEKDDEDGFAEIEKAILDNIEDLHWSESEQMYCDANIDEDEESYHVCHKGYLSLFPFMLGLLSPDSPHLGPSLDLLRSPDHLWSQYGIRSLSASHPLFGQGENYWRGPIWIQMNFLVLQSLHNIYAARPGPHQARARSIYTELRENIIENVHNEYERTGYVWEQYDALSGEGRRSHPFTGWTSLVTLILSEKY
ncbi:glycoside hydrolase family 63 protein [Gautieria morchelliformis]|nr:glycoside hydrolase family 63 protein [Gautieria morchelliformis]